MVIDSRTAYGFGARIEAPYDEAVDRVKRALQGEGFGVLWEIDVRRTLKEKRGVDFRKYVILGACNPQLAHQILVAEIDVGLLLPCNVVVYEVDGGSVVEALDPEVALGLVRNDALAPLAAEAKERLGRALAEVARG